MVAKVWTRSEVGVARRPLLVAAVLSFGLGLQPNLDQPREEPPITAAQGCKPEPKSCSTSPRPPRTIDRASSPALTLNSGRSDRCGQQCARRHSTKMFPQGASTALAPAL